MLIPRSVLEIYRVASKDEERPNLNCVHAERESEPRLTATDGARLLTVTWKEPDVDEEPADFGDLRRVNGFAAGMPTDTCAELARVTPKGGALVYQHAWLEETNTVGIVRAGAGEKANGQAVQCETKRPELEFPDWSRVLPIKGAVKIGIDGQLLAELLKVVCRITDQRGVVLHVPSDPTAPIGLHVDSADGLLKLDAVLMPMRLDLTGRPDWDDVPVLPNTPDKVSKPKTEKAPDLLGAPATKDVPDPA